MEHLDDRPRSAPTGRLAPEDVNWFPLVRAAFLAALTAFLVKLVSLGFFANRRDISLEVQFWKGFIPHLSMQTPPADFAQIVTASTMVMAVVSTVIFTVMVLRPNADKMVVWGWFMGVFVTFETLCLELLRHLLEPPVVDTTTVWRTAIPLTAGAAIAVVYSLVSREPVAVVCAGCKSILDIGATLERLETLNVPVLGYRTRKFPGFYLNDSGFPLDWHWYVGYPAGKQLSVVARAFLAFLQEEGKHMADRRSDIFTHLYREIA